MKVLQNFKSNLFYGLSAVAFIILNAQLNIQYVARSVFYLAIVLYAMFKVNKINAKEKKITSWIFTAVALYLGIYCFCFSFLPSSAVRGICGRIGVNSDFAVVFAALVLAVFSLKFVYTTITLCISKMSAKIKTDDFKKTDTKKVLIFCFVSAFVLLSICSKNSYLYAFNDWVDINCFMTVGKSIANGKVLYRDVFDHKGPIIYFLYSLVWLISNDTFIGAFIIEVIAQTAFLYFAYRAMELYGLKKLCFTLPLFAALIYSSDSFVHGGSVEEFFMPMFMYCIYISLKAYKNDEFFSKGQLFTVGIFAGIVLWIKFNVLAFFAGWAIVPGIWLISEKRWSDIFKTVVIVLSGVVVVTIPLIVYFGMNGAFSDWFKAYFYDNLFTYSAIQGVDNNIVTPISGAYRCIRYNFQYYILIIIGLVFLFIRENAKTKYHFLCMAALTLIAVYLRGQTHYTYYPLTLSPFAILGWIYLCSITKDKVSKRMWAGVFAVTLAVCLFFSSNTRFLGVKKADMPQYKFKEIICKTENPTLLTYKIQDGGFYTVCNILPTCRYFCKVNMTIPELTKEQDSCINEGGVDFVITETETEFEKYELVTTAQSAGEHGKTDTFYLYRLAESE